VIKSAHYFSTGAAGAAGATAAHQLAILAAGVTDALLARPKPVGP
jgi:hypothetical protein